MLNYIISQRKYQSKDYFQSFNRRNITIFLILFFINSIAYAKPISTSISKRDNSFELFPLNDNINLNLDPIFISSNNFFDNNDQEVKTLAGISSSQEIGDLALSLSVTDNLQGSSVDSSSQDGINFQLASNSFENTNPFLLQNDGTLFTEADPDRGIKEEIDQNVSGKIELYGKSAKRIYCGIPLQAERVIYSSDDIQVIAKKDVVKSEIIFSFRGYEPADHIIRDMTLIQYLFDQSSKVHQGFFKIFQNHRKVLIDRVLTEINKNINFSLSMTGFDSGGDINVYTFGQPRIGDKAFAKLVTENLIVRRVVLDNDSIPHSPQIHQGYIHFDTEYWIQSHGISQFYTFKCEAIKDQSGKYLRENPVSF
ncbi:hypothetical protein G9A89_001238 [Geosiphon pyriformis]|nr:hypothetical protein G9A89_001238 [Geosiphon pyriformis]